MSLSIGIVGLPNVGKSTLFNALLERAQAESANRPFTTIEPNEGVVDVPDPRLAKLTELVKPERTVPATVQFTDIAGLVGGASKGEGLGNKFLAHIRETSAIALVVRCFEDPQVTHVSGKLNPVDDLRTVLLELILADQQTYEKLVGPLEKEAKGNPDAAERLELFRRIGAAFDAEQPARSVAFDADERKTLAKGSPLPFITAKPMLVVANVDEGDVAKPGTNSFFQEAERWAEPQGFRVVAVSAKIEAEIGALPPEERPEFLESVGLTEPNLNRFIQAGYGLLDLITFYTAGPKEVRAWPIRRGSSAPQAAGTIHGDFEAKFIRAEVIAYEDFIAAGSESAARDTGKLRAEGKEYVVQDGDVMHIRHGA
ncbi:MAG: redox-regulated ATPase YchF [bacterium]|nr:redox-regulated ATPase YchF [bacterium]